MFPMRWYSVCSETCQRHVPTLWRYRFGWLHPAVKSFYHQGFFAVKRRAVFILGAKWIALVRGWRRDCVVGGMGNSFPMTQSAQSHRQMRSIPHCPKAVFYVFDSIHNSATLHNLSPGIFHWTENIPNGISSHLLRNNSEQYAYHSRLFHLR